MLKLLALALAISTQSFAAKPVAPIKNKTLQFAVVAKDLPCSAADAQQICSTDTFVVATNIATQTTEWERRIFYITYDSEKPIEKQAVTAKIFSFEGPKSVKIIDSRGNTFLVDAAQGHLKQPKDAKDYSAKK